MNLCVGFGFGVGRASGVMLALVVGAVVFGAPDHAAAEAARDVEAGPIWSQADAEAKCPEIARQAGGRWTGHWATTIPGVMSVCNVAPGQARDVEAGPIWNQADAEAKCPEIARQAGGRWTGHWATTVPGRMSVCNVDFGDRRAVEVGPIWSQADAELICPAVAIALDAAWTGQWRTTEPGRMSVCELEG